MFTEAIEVIKSLDLKEGYTYRAEYLKSRKHNSIFYNRVPKNHLMVFDINSSEEQYLSRQDKVIESDRLGLEVVPEISCQITSLDELKATMEIESVLGGHTLEGIAIKNYSRFGRDGKVLMGKFVSEKFKEKHNKEWKKANPNKSDIIEHLTACYKTTPRWDKGIQHLREQGLLTNTPSDIGVLMAEISKDTLDECGDEIKDVLFKWAWKQLGRNITRGFPEYYKEVLAKNQFQDNPEKKEEEGE